MLNYSDSVFMQWVFPLVASISLWFNNQYHHEKLHLHTVCRSHCSRTMKNLVIMLQCYTLYLSEQFPIRPMFVFYYVESAAGEDDFNDDDGLGADSSSDGASVESSSGDMMSSTSSMSPSFIASPLASSSSPYRSGYLDIHVCIVWNCS